MSLKEGIIIIVLSGIPGLQKQTKTEVQLATTSCKFEEKEQVAYLDNIC